MTSTKLSDNYIRIIYLQVKEHRAQAGLAEEQQSPDGNFVASQVEAMNQEMTEIFGAPLDGKEQQNHDGHFVVTQVEAINQEMADLFGAPLDGRDEKKQDERRQPVNELMVSLVVFPH